MAISITRADVKRKAMIASADTSYDTMVDSLISEMQPATEFSIVDASLADTGNTGLQATLKLGILEIIAGELLQQLAREMGANEQFSIGGVTIGEMAQHGPELVQQGAERLAPYMKMMAENVALSTTRDTEPQFDIEEV